MEKKIYITDEERKKCGKVKEAFAELFEMENILVMDAGRYGFVELQYYRPPEGFGDVNMVTGYKFQYRNGDWKRIYQPITNEMCKEYGLSVVSAEYSKEPSNMPHNEYKQNQRFHDFIREDCESLLAISEDTKHFIWLLRELGYEVKEGVHIAVKVPGIKRFARLDTIDKRYAHIYMCGKIWNRALRRHRGGRFPSRSGLLIQISTGTGQRHHTGKGSTIRCGE